MRGKRWVGLLAGVVACALTAGAQMGAWKPNLTIQQTYTPHRSSSWDRTGGNHDYLRVAPGQTVTVLNADGPGEVSHIWFTLADGEPYFLKRVVLRMYWDGEKDPSVDTPIGDFFGLGLGYYYTWHSAVLSVGNERAMNCFFPMPFAHHARITVTNEGKQPIDALYYNIDYRTYSHPLPKGTLYFHAEYRQAQPNHGVNATTNLDGKNNYVWMTAKGHGQFVGVTMSVLQNQNGWWGEGDDMFFIDGAKRPQIEGTGSEDYFLGAWDFGDKPFSYSTYGAPVTPQGHELEGSRWSLYRFHLDQPIPFTKSLKATIEHGTADDRSDNFYSVAYWYQSLPHAPLPALPPVEDRIPRIMPVGK
jgi:hypothetical protein